MLSRDYFYLPPPLYEVHRKVTAARTAGQIIGMSRRQTGDVVYRVLCDDSFEIVSVPESQIKSSNPPPNYRGFLWHIDFHFPNKWTYHAENFVVLATNRPLSLRNLSAFTWKDNSQRFLDWIEGHRKCKVDATLTMRTNDGWLVDSWHIYDLQVIKYAESFETLLIDFDYQDHQRSDIHWEETLQYEIRKHDNCVVASMPRAPYGKRVRKPYSTMVEAHRLIVEMENRYQNVGRFFLDAALQEQLELSRIESAVRGVNYADYQYL